jgi:uncharacterized protein (DUF885 family)
MPITCTVDRDRGLLLGVAKGSLSRADVLAHIEERETFEGAPSLPLLLDATEARHNAMTQADVREVVDRLRQLAKQHRLAATAIVVRDDVSYGVLRMMEILAEDVCHIQPFRDRGAAEQWLRGATR